MFFFSDGSPCEDTETEVKATVTVAESFLTIVAVYNSYWLSSLFDFVTWFSNLYNLFDFTNYILSKNKNHDKPL